jgi:hypothetical protein
LPAIGPIGLEYVAETAARAGIEVDVLDLALSEDPEKALREHLLQRSSTLIGLTFRNVDDCFWPSAQWFVPELAELVQRIRRLSEAPIVLGGVGFSVFAEQIVEYTGADFGIHGDGEQATVSLYRQLEQDRQQFEEVPGLVWHSEKGIRSNPPAWPAEISLPAKRTMVDNRAYSRAAANAASRRNAAATASASMCWPLAKGWSLSRKPAEIVMIESLAQGD